MTRDVDGFADIGDYAVIGDCRSAALVASDGRIDWWPAVDPDVPPTFAAILDADSGGYLELAPVADYEVSRRYVPESNVLETTFVTAAGSVRLLDLIPFGRNGNLAWSELVRRVDGLDGAVEMKWKVVTGNRFGRATPEVTVDRGNVIVIVGDESLAVRAFDVGEPQVNGSEVGGRFTSSPGSVGLLAVVAARQAPLFLNEKAELEGHIGLTLDRWCDWTRSVTYDGPWRAEVLRSALALKLLTSIQTGAILAAPTTSLPERVGGTKNWDYRYMWVRDASFTIDAFLSLGLHAEAQAAVQWLLGAVRGSAPELKSLYRLSGEPADPELILPLPGYRGSRPVRIGNAASHQVQLGNFGDLFDTVARYVVDGHWLNPLNAAILVELADRCCSTWMLADSGIWELETKRHYTISKVGCWVALDRALQLCDCGQLPAEHAGRWREVRDEIDAWVNANCWSDDQSSYVWYAGTEDLDAATLLLGRTGFARGDRLRGTIRAVRDNLADGPHVYRYSGAADEEGAFLACSFWLVQALVAAGEMDEAAALMQEAVTLTTDLGLMAEQRDPQSGDMLGNFPQGLSHLALINAACAYAKATAGDDGDP
jgi:GH15 family glucan-1,4-alpha-glucosidase